MRPPDFISRLPRKIETTRKYWKGIILHRKEGFLFLLLSAKTSEVSLCFLHVAIIFLGFNYCVDFSVASLFKLCYNITCKFHRFLHWVWTLISFAIALNSSWYTFGLWFTLFQLLRWETGCCTMAFLALMEFFQRSISKTSVTLSLAYICYWKSGSAAKILLLLTIASEIFICMQNCIMVSWQ